MMTNQVSVIRLILLLSAGLATAAEMPRPNIVCILIDDLGWSDLSCQGSRLYETPHIDRFAEQGLRFTSAYAAAPLCSATRASLMTGRYPARLRLTGATVYPPPGRQRPAFVTTSSGLVLPQEIDHLPLEEVTVAEMLRTSGYRCACIGKWHLGEASYYPDRQGFDVAIGGYHQGFTHSHFSPYGIPTLPDGPAGEYLADRLTREAEKFLEDNQARPFFLYLPYYAVHTPLQAPGLLVRKYERKLAREHLTGNPRYAAMVESMDTNVGRLLAKLDALGLAKTTVVLLLSDNGGLLHLPNSDVLVTSNAPLRGGKAMLYEGGIRVPWMVRWPGVIQPGRVCEAPVSTIDFVPTVRAIVNATDLPENTSDGVDLVPVFKGQVSMNREQLFWHFPHSTRFSGPCSAVRKGNLKLIQYYEDDHVELYDLASDLGETLDLNRRRPADTGRLRNALRAWLKEMDAQLPVRRAKEAVSSPS